MLNGGVTENGFSQAMLDIGTTSGTMLWREVLITKMHKLESRIRRKPTPTDIRFDELSKFMESKGFQLKPPGRGSHRAFYHPAYEGIVTVSVPHNSSDGVKREYIRQALEAVDQVMEEMEKS